MNENSLLTIGVAGNIGFILAAFFSLAYSVEHYSDGGCDGGLCALGIVFHGFPLALSWLLTILAFNLYLMGSRLFFVYLSIAAAINVFLLMLDYGYPGNEVIPVFVLLLVHVGLFVLSYALKNTNKADASHEE